MATFSRFVGTRGIPEMTGMSRRRPGHRHPGPRARLAPYRPGVESMERRELLATFFVMNNNPSGTGSLRDAINQANSMAGLDTIAFSLPSNQLTITPAANNSGPLPDIVDPVIINGTTQAPNSTTPSRMATW